MPVKTTNAAKRLYYISPENLAELQKRAPRTGHQRGGRRNTTIPLNSSLTRLFAFCDAGLRHVWAALPDERDRAFIRFVLMGVAFDDVTLTENPIAYLREIEEAAGEYGDASVADEEGEEPFTPALLPALRRFGPLEALALVDWIEQERVSK